MLSQRPNATLQEEHFLVDVLSKPNSSLNLFGHSACANSIRKPLMAPQKRKTSPSIGRVSRVHLVPLHSWQGGNVSLADPPVVVELIIQPHQGHGMLPIAQRALPPRALAEQYLGAYVFSLHLNVDRQR